MLESLKSWVVGIAVSGILISVTKGLMPKGSVKKVVAVLCSSIFILAVVGGMREIDFEELSEFTIEQENALSQYNEELEATNQYLKQTIIEEQCEAYILDKAKKLGAEVSAEVNVEMDGTGEYYLSKVVVSGSCSPLIKTALSEYISNELGVSSENQSWQMVS